MRMNRAFSHALLLAAAGLVLASCGAADDGAGEGGPDPTKPTDGTNGSGLTRGPTPAAAPPPQSCETTSYCAGQLLVRSDNLTLSQESGGWLNVVGTLSFENRSAQDLRIALMREDIVLNLSNGSKVEQGNFRNVTGLGHCIREGAECFATTPDTFRVLAPGDSPAKVNLSLAGGVTPSLTPTVPQIDKGTLTLTAYTVAADGDRRLHRVSLANVPITNQLAQ
ncbi:hypothetical protein J4558_14815 [Leptolyngbya sp. 15MV]|nr:hypothetical protein J4558_14815 [Leptolyngbya sp. 15MV]